MGPGGPNPDPQAYMAGTSSPAHRAFYFRESCSTSHCNRTVECCTLQPESRYILDKGSEVGCGVKRRVPVVCFHFQTPSWFRSRNPNKKTFWLRHVSIHFGCPLSEWCLVPSFLSFPSIVRAQLLSVDLSLKFLCIVCSYHIVYRKPNNDLIMCIGHFTRKVKYLELCC